MDSLKLGRSPSLRHPTRLKQGLLQSTNSSHGTLQLGSRSPGKGLEEFSWPGMSAPAPWC